MRSKEFKVDCEYFDTRLETVMYMGGASDTVRHPVCRLEGSPNDPPSYDRPFADNCAECPHNKWQE